MMRKTVPTRRFPSRHPLKKGGRDPYLCLLGAQITLCALVVLLTFAAVDAKPLFLPTLAERYRALIGTREPLLSSVAALSDRYAVLRDSALDTLSEVITELVTPVRASAAVLPSGAGGWMGAPGKTPHSVPGNCDVTPLALSVRAQPPVSGRVTSAFGYRSHPITETDDFHRGLDVAAVQGAEIRASLPGVVIETDSSAIYGNYITLDHGSGLQTTYCHCDALVARMGEKLRAGELLATVGSTGISTGPHCHFEIKKNGRYYNPAWVLAGMSGYGV